MKKKILAGALFGLVILGAERAEANKKITLTVRSCDPQGLPWKQTDQDGRMGRLRIEDQAGQTLQTEVNVHFSASRCQATFTSTFLDATLARFVDPDDPLFLTLEACKNNQTTCTYVNGVLDDKPFVFQDSPLDSILPEIHQLIQDELLAEIQDRIAAGDAETAARIAADQAELARATAAEQSLSDALAAEIARALAAEADGGSALAAEVSRAIAAELAEAAAREQGLAAEAAARIAAIEEEAGARVAADEAEVAARIAAIAEEADARAAADTAEADARAAGDQAVRDYTDETFLPLTGGTVDGELVVTGALRLNGGVSWDACPEGLDSVEHVFEANQGTNNRLCASAFMQTDPSVQLNEVLGSYIEPICPMVTQVVQNYVEIGGPAAIEGINLLLQQVSGLLNDQIAPFANGLIGATTDVTNGLIDSINGKIGEINGLVAAHTAGINGVIDAYNGLVTKINTALTSSTNGLNGSITAINNYLTTVRNEINGVVAGINSAVGDVNTAFASIDSSLGSASDALNAFNSSPSGINTALSSLTTTLNARIATINGLLDSISSAQSSIVGGVNSALSGANTFFSNSRNAIIDAHSAINATVGAYDQMGYWLDQSFGRVLGGVNDSFVAVNSGIVTAAQFATGVGNWLVVNLFNPIANWCIPATSVCLSSVIGGTTSQWVAPVVGQGSTTISLGDFAPGSPITFQIFNGTVATAPLPAASLATLGSPAALGHVGNAAAPTISSLGLPTFDLGVSASMRTVSHGLNAPALAAVNAPQIVGANLSALASPAIPAIPHVDLPTIPAWDGFQLEDAVDFDGVAGLIGATMDPICADIAGTTQSYIDAFLGDVPALVPAYGDAEEECGALGAHVCSATEIGLLAGEWTDEDHEGTPFDVGYGFGDWTGDGTVMFNQAATSGLMVETAWPFFHPDASKLMTFPPGFPFTFTPPVLPTGRFRCCASSSSFQ